MIPADRPRRRVAITGGTGFLGRYVVAAFAQAGWDIKLLVRRDPTHPQLGGISAELVPGDLFDTGALRRFSADVDVIIHIAGSIKAASGADFFRNNDTGSANLAKISSEIAPSTPIIAVSSLAARAPDLSDYAASKAAGEQALRTHAKAPVTILRPSVIYGPWDSESLILFQMARRGFMPIPKLPKARLGFVAAADVAQAILAFARTKAVGGPFELTDHRTQGYGWNEIAEAAAHAVGTTPRLIPVPGVIWRSAGWISLGLSRLTGQVPMISPGKIRELLHPDWGSDPARQPPPEIWTPNIPLETGFDTTVTWARQVGKLPKNPL